MSSRKGKSISSRACDYCRERKIKCSWNEGGLKCIGCTDNDLLCSYDTHRKRRGRPNSRIERFKRSGIDRTLPLSGTVAEDGPHFQNLTQAAGNLLVAHLCPSATFDIIIHDFLDLIYPIAPILHQPLFRRRYESRDYEKEPDFFRLCISVCAMTIASLPRKISTYGFGRYSKATDMVARACNIVTASRFATSPDWAEQPSSDTMICSLLLGTASHYTHCAKRGWVLFNESIHCCRNLELYLPRGYEGLGIIDREVNKRAFWMLFIVQIHDRLSHRNPHTTLAQDPILTDWEFLLPLEVDDEYLTSEKDVPIIHHDASTPIISGFVTLIKVFSCLLSLVSTRKTSTSSQLSTQPLFPSFPESPLPSDPTISSALGGSVNGTIAQDTLVQTMQSLESVVSDIPEDLKLFSMNNTSSANAHQFDIMKANIHITKLYLQSWILDHCPAESRDFLAVTSPGQGSVDGRSDSSPTNHETWKIQREEIARQLLQVLNLCSQSTLESHGSSMVIKIREIAATLLDKDGPNTTVLDVSQPSQHYIACFLDILASLDFASHQAMADMD